MLLHLDKNYKKTKTVAVAFEHYIELIINQITFLETIVHKSSDTFSSLVSGQTLNVFLKKIILTLKTNIYINENQILVQKIQFYYIALNCTLSPWLTLRFW